MQCPKHLEHRQHQLDLELKMIHKPPTSISSPSVAAPSQSTPSAKTLTLLYPLKVRDSAYSCYELCIAFKY